MKIKKTIHFAEEGEGGGGESAQATIIGEASSEEISAALFGETASEEKSAETTTDPAGDKPADDVVADDKKPASDKPADDKPATDAVDDGELKVPELVEEAKESTWIDVATDLGVAAPESPDDFDTVKNNIQAKFVSEYERGKSEGKAEVQTLDLDKFDPEAQSVISALQSGTKLEDILLPLQGYNAALALSANDRLTNYYTAVLKMTADQAADQIAVLEANGQLVATDAEIKTKLENARDAEYKSIIGKGQEAYAQKIAAEKVRTEKENNDIRSAITSRTEFMGAKLSEEHQAALVKNWEAGKYKKLMAEDPQAVVDFICWKEFGKQQTERLVKTAVKDTKLAVVKKHANTPAQVTGTKAQQEKVMDTNAHFDPESIKEQLSQAKGVQFGRK